MHFSDGAFFSVCRQWGWLKANNYSYVFADNIYCSSASSCYSKWGSSVLKSDLIKGGNHGYYFVASRLGRIAYWGRPTSNNAAHLASTHHRNGLEIRQALTLLSGNFFFECVLVRRHATLESSVGSWPFETTLRGVRQMFSKASFVKFLIIFVQVKSFSRSWIGGKQGTWSYETFKIVGCTCFHSHNFLWINCTMRSIWRIPLIFINKK